MSLIRLATGVEVATFSRIEEMIQELVQPEGLEVPDTGMTSEGTNTMTGEPSSQSSLPKDLPSLDSQLGKRIKILYILPFSSLLLILILCLQRVPGWLKWKSSWQALAQRTAQFKFQQPNQVLEVCPCSCRLRAYHSYSPRGAGHDLDADRTCCWPRLYTK